MRLIVTVSGLSEARQALAKLGPEIKATASRELRTTAHDIENRAKQIVPVDTTFLQKSIGVTAGNGGLTAVIGPYANYAAYVEYGTSKMKAQPYMRPAFDAEAPKLGDRLEQAIQGLI